MLTVLVALAAISYSTFLWINQCPRLEALKDSVVVLVGASSGIGAELAIQYGQLGASLVLAARRKEQLEEVATQALEAGATAVITVPTDLSDPAAVTSLIETAIARFTRIDILFLNQAVFDDDLFVSYPDAQSIDKVLSRAFKSNVVGSAMAARVALPYLERVGGHIAVTSSASAKVAAPFHVGYVASKCALHGVFDTLRAELHLLGSNVTIGLQVLGMIATKEVIADSALVDMAEPVPAVASEMICSAQARWDHTYVPKWYWAWSTLT